MRQWIDLFEKWHTAINYAGENMDVFVDPTRAEIARLIADDEFGSVRAWVTPDHLYVFSANASHGDMESVLPVDRHRDGRLFIDRDGPYINENDPMGDAYRDPNDPELDDGALDELNRTMAMIRNNPVLTRYYGGRIGCR